MRSSVLNSFSCSRISLWEKSSCPAGQESFSNSSCSPSRGWGWLAQMLLAARAHKYCIFMTDSRAVETVDVESMSNASVVTLTYEANKLYCKILGNCLVYFNVPDPVADYPERKVGWGKISVMIREMSRREEECEFGVSIDTDAYFRTRENLDNIVEDFELDGSKLVGIAEEFHQEELEFEDPFPRGHA
ncbi:hypothetical protein FOZ63_033455, partial [Perkinsus olseni]